MYGLKFVVIGYYVDVICEMFGNYEGNYDES